MLPRSGAIAILRRGLTRRSSDHKMVFKRRTKRTWRQVVADSVWPKGGWLRAAAYVWHRLRRLPDPPHRIARGVFAGIFISFTPLFGLHFFLAILLTLILRGNVLAALFATFVGNPLTFPFIAALSVELGAWMLGMHGGMPMLRIADSFYRALLELWFNLTVLFSPARMHWDRFAALFDDVFLAYLVGGIVPGIIAGGIGYMITHRVIEAYQRARVKRLKKRVERRRALAAAAAAKAAKIAAAPKSAAHPQAGE